MKKRLKAFFACCGMLFNCCQYALMGFIVVGLPSVLAIILGFVGGWAVLRWLGWV